MRGARLRLAAIAALLAGGPAPAAPAPLRIVVIDVEGGAASLWITPDGRSLLIDAGWPSGMGGGADSSAERIVAAARAAGLKRIDTLLVTHYHVDHVGGVAELLARFPVGEVLDHGPNRETPSPDAPPAQLAAAPAALYPAYLRAVAGHAHRSLKPGDRVRVGALDLVVADSDGAVLARPLPGAGEPGAECARATEEAQNGGEENARSLGVLARWGRARLLALGDTTWNVENRLACPRDLLGPVDLMIASHHGSALSSSPVLVDAVRPRVAVLQNGPRKGGDPQVFDTFRASPRLEALWQMHAATRSPDKDGPAARILNMGDADGRTLLIAVDADSAITLTNGRTGEVERHSAKGTGE